MNAKIAGKNIYWAYYGNLYQFVNSDRENSGLQMRRKPKAQTWGLNKLESLWIDELLNLIQ